MKWMNFIPLLVWSIGMYAVMSWDEHRRAQVGLPMEDSTDGGRGAIWLLGVVVFLVIGCWLSQ